MIELICQCGRVFSVRDDDAGKRARCPKCGVFVGIPVPAMASPALPNGIDLAKPAITHSWEMRAKSLESQVRIIGLSSTLGMAILSALLYAGTFYRKDDSGRLVAAETQIKALEARLVAISDAKVEPGTEGVVIGKHGIAMKDKFGKIRFFMGTSDADGSPSITLMDENQNDRLVMKLTDMGSPMVGLLRDPRLGKDSHLAITIIEAHGEPEISLWDTHDRPRWLVHLDENDNPLIKTQRNLDGVPKR